MEDTKKCTKCGRELPLNQFCKKTLKNGGAGHVSRCRGCRAAQYVEWRHNNPDKVRKAHADWYQNNKERSLVAAAEWHKNNLEKAKASRAKWRKNNPGYGTKLRHNNLEKFQLLARELARKRRRSDLEFRLSVNIRRGMLRALCGGQKNAHTEELLGCSIKEARNHLERLFQSGMSWDNYGYRGWHIDHIIPLSYFDHSDPEQQRRAWHYTNLQPLWAIDNLRKSNKIEERQLILL